MHFQKTEYADLLNFHFYENLESAVLADMKKIPKGTAFYTVDVGQAWLKFFKCHFTNINLQILPITALTKKSTLSSASSAFILPELNFTIFNINYDRIATREVSNPYLVLIKNLKSKKSAQFFIEYGFQNVGEIFNFFPHLARHYMQSKLLLDWLTNSRCPEPHSGRIEKKFFDSDAYSQLDEAQLKIFFNITSDSSAIAFDHYPIHLFYLSYLKIDLNVNLVERSLYEF